MITKQVTPKSFPRWFDGGGTHYRALWQFNNADDQGTYIHQNYGQEESSYSIRELEQMGIRELTAAEAEEILKRGEK